VNRELYEKALEVWSNGPKVAEEYHDSTGFMSNSFIGDFKRCEYSAIIKYAKIEKEEGFKDAFAVGHLTEAICFEGEAGEKKMLDRYKDDAFMKSGKPKAWVNNSREYAESIMRHDNISRLLKSEGSKYHKTLIFNMLGMAWRAEVDYLNLNKAVEVDMKTTKSSFKERSWNDNLRGRFNTFIDDWDYHRQRAIYQRGIKQLYDVDVTPHILAVSKKNKSVRFFKFDDQDLLNSKIKGLQEVVDRVKRVLSAEDEPNQCEECSHCVDSEVIDFVIKTSEYCAGE